MSFIRNHPVFTFFVLAYALAWGAVPFGSFFAPGALVAALIVVFLTEGVAGLRAIGARLIRWRVRWIWYVVALAVPLLIHFVTISINQALGASAPSTGQFTPWYGIALAIGMNMIDPFGGPFSEEPSFRGFAQASLQAKRTPLVATAIMAAAITGWHLPLFFISSFGLHPYEALTTVAVTFWYAWLFNHAAGSVLITLIAHATEGSINTSDLWSAGADATRESWLYAAVWCALAVGLLVFNRHFWTSPASADSINPGRRPAEVPEAVS
ncbi:type II CAAX prenyl endopeptidase Rce1 family protein [Kribbella qitaiheensis]|uniref:CPBP family glutamic-type intramembrane protease n=1 Tax=Kribbella qitaiheensis TaxID=1544730 RepID=UPI00361BF68F